MMPVFKLLLLPFALIYKALTGFRNHLYDIGYKRSVQFDRFVISVGNLTVGGTGKTPFVELLIRKLKPDYKMAVLSRGYGRKTRGFRLASEIDDAGTLGDEPFQYYRKFGREVKVAVGEERALAIPEILFRHEETNLIVLDDAFQHRSVKPDLSVLLNDFHRPFYSDLVMPAGLLRESRKNARRSDIVVVTKCPEALDESEMAIIEQKIRKYAGTDKPVFFSAIRYLEPKRLYGEGAITNKVVLFSGIANTRPLEAYVQQHFQLVDHIKFPDHHAYTSADIRKLTGRWNDSEMRDTSFLTTEKDVARLLNAKGQFLENYPVFYLPIELYFLKNEDSFAKILDLKIRQGLREKGFSI